MPTLLGMSGALRRDSTNTLLIRNAAAIFNPDSFTSADLDLPLFNEDIETRDGIPPFVQRLADQIGSADAIVISTPEYNKSISGVLKNALDWVSRTKGHPWADKPVAIMSAAAGRAGGERAQFALRLCLMPFRPRILQGPEVLVADARNQFDDNGHLTNEINRKALTDLMAALRAMT